MMNKSFIVVLSNSSNFRQLKKFWFECKKEWEESDHDPEELLPHPDNAADPGKQGQVAFGIIKVIIILDFYSSYALADGKVGSGLLHLPVKSHEQPVSIFSGVKTNIGGLITVTTC